MIIAVVPDRFKARFQNEALVSKYTNGYGQSDVRRPTRGIQLKKDTYATMRVILGNGTVLQLVNAGSRRGATKSDGKLYSDDYSNFLIQAVAEERIEKSQILETFGEAFIFFFGERPRVLNIQGALINTFDFNWEAEWWWNYDNYLRGTQCVKNDARVYLTFDDVMVSGYIMSSSATRQAQERNVVPFTFQLFVTDYTNLSAIGDPNPNQSGNEPVGDWRDNAKYRPMLIPTQGMSALLKPGTPVSLIEAYATAGVKAVRATWQRANQLVNNALTSVDAILGNPVRIPQGFEGALAFDEPEFELSILGGAGLAALGQPLKYTTKFGDNSDEFVGEGSQYASSSTEIGDAMYAAFSGLSDFQNGQEMVLAAVEKWADNGLFVAPSAVSKALYLASKTSIGMKVIGSARDVVRTGAQAVGAAQAGLAPIVAGTSEVLGDVALADSIVTETSGGANVVALDRAAAQSAPSSFEILNGLKKVGG